ncbi:restriction endonuclease subunit S [Paenibacillus sp. Y412MC10]|uniref:restriction endonuclease subunit S n=1 Tax=Geobacillus sp. (strain Y412MC10) TaxID=481743 RepID=UPI0011A8D612|nr:restriction endonuclease subunit S [Paenibacillus sp. Y412MC10]
MTEQTNLVPKRRFKEYQKTDVWEQRTVSELADRYDNLRVPITASDRVAGNTPYYGANGIQDYVEGFTHDGEFILVAEDGANDLKNYPVLYVNGKVWVNNHAHVLQAKSEFADNKFLMSALKQTNIEPYLVGGGRAKLNADVMMKISIRVPELSEQKQIGSFFSKLDHLITLHQRKLEKMKSLKSAYLSEMFPAEGECEPRRRFAGFTGPWEQRTVGELTNVASAARVHKEEWASSGIPFFRSSDVVSAYKGKENEKAFISIELYEQLARVSGKLEKDDILITGGGSIGIPYIVPNNDPLYSKDADLIWIKSSEKFNSRYLYAYFISPEFRRYLSGISHIGTIAHYTIEQVKETPIRLPSIDEQNEIGSYFTKLDNLITLHQRKLEKLQNLKRAYLNEMFV